MKSAGADTGRGTGPRLVAVAGFVLVSFVAGCVPDRPVRTPLDRLLSTWPCSEVVGDLLASEGGGADFLVAPPSHDGDSSVRIPVRGRLGSWLVLHRRGAGVTMERWDDARLTIRVVDGGCRAGAMEGPSTQRGIDGPSFTDRDLRAVVGSAGDAADDTGGGSGRSGTEGASGVVVYAWSPHMPLSVDGFQEIEAAADELGLRVVPVLFAGSDLVFARREADRVGMPQTALREIRSTELTMRDLQVHAPSILVLRGERVSPVLPGYRNAAGYRRYLTDLLADRSR